MEKITFAYASQILPGSPANTIRQPESAFFVTDFPSKVSFTLYAGMILERDKPYSINIDVFNGEQSLLKDKSIPGATTPYNISITPYGDFISTSSTDILNVMFTEEGLHEIKINLHDGYIDDSKDKILDSFSCFVVIRKAWRANE